MGYEHETAESLCTELPSNRCLLRTDTDVAITDKDTCQSIFTVAG